MNGQKDAGTTVLLGTKKNCLVLDISGSAVHLHTGIPWESIPCQLAFFKRKNVSDGGSATLSVSRRVSMS